MYWIALLGVYGLSLEEAFLSFVLLLYNGVLARSGRVQRRIEQCNGNYIMITKSLFSAVDGMRI